MRRTLFVSLFILLCLITVVYSQETVETNTESVKEEVSEEKGANTLPTWNIFLNYGGGSMASGSIYYRVNPFIRFGMGLGYTPEGRDANYGFNVMPSALIDLIMLPVGPFRFDLSLHQQLIYFSEGSFTYFGMGPAVFINLKDFQYVSAGVFNDFYFRDGGLIWQMGFSLILGF